MFKYKNVNHKTRLIHYLECFEKTGANLRGTPSGTQQLLRNKDLNYNQTSSPNITRTGPGGHQLIYTIEPQASTRMYTLHNDQNTSNLRQ
jgi:hypothetical protein